MASAGTHLCPEFLWQAAKMKPWSISRSGPISLNILVSLNISRYWESYSCDGHYLRLSLHWNWQTGPIPAVPSLMSIKKPCPVSLPSSIFSRHFCMLFLTSEGIGLEAQLLLLGYLPFPGIGADSTIAVTNRIMPEWCKARVQAQILRSWQVPLLSLETLPLGSCKFRALLERPLKSPWEAWWGKRAWMSWASC